MSLFLADLRCHVGEEGFLRVAINNRSEIKDRRVVYGIKRVYGQVRASTPLPALRGKKQHLARSRAEFSGDLSYFPGRKIALCLPVGAPPPLFRFPPGGVVSRSTSRNNHSDSAPPGKERPLARAQNFPPPLCPTDIIALSKCGFVVEIFSVA